MTPTYNIEVYCNGDGDVLLYITQRTDDKYSPLYGKVDSIEVVKHKLFGQPFEKRVEEAYKKLKKRIEYLNGCNIERERNKKECCDVVKKVISEVNGDKI